MAMMSAVMVADGEVLCLGRVGWAFPPLLVRTLSNHHDPNRLQQNVDVKPD